MRVFDLHNDVLTQTKNPYEILEGGIDDVKICTAIYNDNLNKNEFYNYLNDFKIHKPSNAILCFEDIGYDFLTVEDIISFKPFYAQLTYNGENKYGYGCNFNEKLKPLGVDAVKKLSSSEIYVDVAHLSEKGALQVCELTNKVICSHALFKEVYNCKRNLSKSVIKSIILNGGIIGACFVGYFVADVNGSSKIEDFIKHIDYFIENFGDDNLALGTDFYGSDTFVDGIDNYDKLSRFIDALYKKGYSVETVNKILYKNALKLLN